MVCGRSQAVNEGGMVCYGLFCQAKLMMLDFGDDVVRVLQGLVGPHLRLTIALWDGITTPPV